MAKKSLPSNGKWTSRIVGMGEEPPDQLLANPMNFRIHPAMQQAALEGSLDTLGWVQQVLVNKRTGNVIDGHLRVALALRHSQPLVPVLYVDLDEDEERQALLSLDPVAAMAATDRDKLDALLRSVQSDDERVQAMMREIAEMERIPFGEQPPEDPGAQIDRAEELREKWGVELGQLWEVGRHRIICGDCTDRAVVERVMGGERIQFILTDPPYGVDYDGGSGNIKKREKLLGDSAPMLYLPFLQIAPIETDCVIYLWHSGREAELVYQAVRECGLTIRSQIIWNKIDAHYGAYMAQYKLKHEPCLYVVHGTPEFCGATNEVTVWDIKQNTTNEYHPTQKPIELFERAINNHPYKLIYDPFAGSGTTGVACERLGRKARMIEISPAYVAVSLQRLADMGLEPKLVE